MTDSKWQVLGREAVMNQPSFRMMLEQVQLPDGRVIADWPMVHAGDFISLLVFDKDGQALVMEGYRHGLKRTTWQMLSGTLREGEDPLVAAKRQLESQVGYVSGNWRYLSSFVMDANQYVSTGHFFLVTNAAPREGVVRPPEGQKPLWIPGHLLNRALWDGRIGAASYAVTVALGLLALQKSPWRYLIAENGPGGPVDGWAD
jgi:8-oxo-dGTP pyrophosphatase MutT (NUDIX family)